MIIAMQTLKSEVHLAKQLAKLYGDTAICYNEMNNDGFSLASHQRISFMGLASPTCFGELRLTSEEFTAFLIRHHLANDKPVVIDLLACSIGDDFGDRSYALRVADCLVANGYSNVTINAFHARNSAQEIARTFLRTPVFIFGKQVLPMRIVGIPTNLYDEFLRKQAFFNNRFNVWRLIETYGKVLIETNDFRGELDNHDQYHIAPRLGS